MPDIPQNKHHSHPQKEVLSFQPERRDPPRDLLVPNFVEWCATSNFSFLYGASHPEELVERAQALGYQGIAVADIHSVAGAVRAHIAAKQRGMRYIVGAQLILYRELPPISGEPPNAELPPEILPHPEYLLPYSLFLYPKSRQGYGELRKMGIKGKRRAPKGSCFLTQADLPDSCPEWIGIVEIRTARDPSLGPSLKILQQRFLPDDLSLALWNNYGADEELMQEEIHRSSQEHQIPLLATNRPLYHLPERQRLHDVLTCCRKRVPLASAGYLLRSNAERHMKPSKEMKRLFRSYPAAFERTKLLLERIDFSLDELKYEYPHEICPQGMSLTDYLRECTFAGADLRYPDGIPDRIVQLLDYELRLIEELQYEPYFLTVYDIVRFAQERGILCQGRGAAANSAVCYCLGITSVDPNEIRLLMERFISKERNEPPDIDIDFEHERREEVIQYIYQRFGRERAALLCEVVSYRNRMALRDVGKVFGLSPETIERLIHLVSRNDEASITAEHIARYELDPRDQSILFTLELAEELKGFPRHLSQHVGGFVITEGQLDELCPIENAGMPDRTVIEWDKDDIEALGMLKIDLLALGILSCIRKALTMINAYRDPETPPLELHTVPGEVPEVYDMLCKADSIGTFQVESRAQMSMLPRLKPRTFYDLVVQVAIVRPGPIQGGMVHPYLRRRSGQERITYPNEKIRSVLERTLGVPIFQEQAMELAIVAAGFTPGEADRLRRAMASWKKNKNLLRAFRSQLIGGMLGNGYSSEFAEQCFQQICGFGEYGFPQSHAASFARLAYISSWLKCFHPAAFAASLINSQPMGFYQPAQIIEDAKRHGVSVLPIDVLFSQWDCTLEGEQKALRLGFRLIRGLRETEGRKVADVVCALQRSSPPVGPLKAIGSLRDLWRQSTLSVATLRKLAEADAFRSLGLSRQEALWELKRFRDVRLPLFEGLEEPEPVAELPEISLQRQMLDDWSSAGLSLKAHPISFFRKRLSQNGAVTSVEIQSPTQTRDGQSVLIAGMVLVRQRPPTASGVTFITLEDEWGMINLVIFPDRFRQLRATVSDYPVLLVQGKLQRADSTVHVIVENARGAELS